MLTKRVSIFNECRVENHCVLMLDHATPGGLIKYNSCFLRFATEAVETERYFSRKPRCETSSYTPSIDTITMIKYQNDHSKQKIIKGATIIFVISFSFSLFFSFFLYHINSSFRFSPLYFIIHAEMHCFI